MIPLTANIPLALCSVVLRRFIDSYTGRLPLAVASTAVPDAYTITVFSGAMVFLYHQLRKGTLVKIGLRKGFSSILRNSKHTIQRRVKNNSWFLRNIDACRRKCTEAVFKILQPSRQSLDNIQCETGTIQAGIINGSASLPVFNQTRASEFRRNVPHIPALEKIYSNDSFGSEADSAQEITIVDAKKNEKNTTKSNYSNIPGRPLTRHFRRAMVRPEDTGAPKKLSTARKRGKKLDQIINEAEDDNNCYSEDGKQICRRSPIRSSGASCEDSKPLSTRCSRQLKKQLAVQKITRKTRSGRVYVYRL